jgi:hypothetical protein
LPSNSSATPRVNQMLVFGTVASRSPATTTLSYLRDEDRLKPTRDRSWTREAPSQFAGKIRGPPGK